MTQLTTNEDGWLTGHEVELYAMDGSEIAGTQTAITHYDVLLKKHTGEGAFDVSHEKSFDKHTEATRFAYHLARRLDTDVDEIGG